MRFTDSYGEQSCTAGRASFITGQSVFRTGLSKVGLPGSPIGLQAEDPTIAELLKPLGYATGQFGKNHFGDLNKYLPTVHGFDEFFGNLYHLNAEEDPEDPDYPKDPKFKEQFAPRGVLHCWATNKDDATKHPRWGRVGKQKIEDTGALTRKRMETCDDDFVDAAADFIKRQQKDGKPFFCWVNTTHMHFRTHTKRRSLGQAGIHQSPYHDTMVDHDKNVGQLLKLLDDLDIAENTIVMYSTDNGPHMNSWPDGAMTPFRSEKNTNWEGAFRVPLCVRWPGKIDAGVVSNEIVQHHDWLPTFLAAAGEPSIVEKCKKGHKAGDVDLEALVAGFVALEHFSMMSARPPPRGMSAASRDAARSRWTPPAGILPGQRTQQRDAERAFPVGVLLAAERRHRAVRPRVHVRPVVRRVHHDRVLGDAELVEVVEHLADVLVVVDHRVVVGRLVRPGLAQALRLRVGAQVHVRRVEPTKNGLPALCWRLMKSLAAATNSSSQVSMRLR